MFEDEIYSFARSGLGEQTDAGALEKLCRAASSELLSRLRQGVDPESIKPLFICASGVLALSMYSALGLGGEYSFRAGNLSVSRRGQRPGADELRAQAEAMLSEYLADRGFEFRSVEG